jgi:ubiquinone/menaquinone biosynthesis C-methylase UbiE
MPMSPLALSIIVTAERGRSPDAVVRAWNSFLHGHAIPGEVLVGCGVVFGPCVRAPLRRATGEYCLIVDGAEASEPGDWFSDLWENRHVVGLILAGAAHTGQRPGLRERVRHFVLRVWQRLLALPVLPDGTVIFCRRSALNRLPEANSRFEWLLECIVLANSEGWPVRRVVGPSPPPFRIIGTGLGVFRRLWVLRNSAFSADYDDRAFNSIIPLQRYWHRRRYAIINRFIDPQTRILDVGCGSSRIVQDLPQAVGLDVQIKKLRRISPRIHKVVQATLTRLPFRSACFDTLICSQVIEHVPEALVDWREMNRVLIDGGTLVVGTPDYSTVAWPVLERLYAIVHPKGYVHEHINRYTAATLRHALESHGFEAIASAYVGWGELIVRARKVKDCMRASAHLLPVRTHEPSGEGPCGLT